MNPIDLLKETLPIWLDGVDDFRKEQIQKLLDNSDKIFKTQIEIAYRYGSMNYYDSAEDYFKQRYEIDNNN